MENASMNIEESWSVFEGNFRDNIFRKETDPHLVRELLDWTKGHYVKCAGIWNRTWHTELQMPFTAEQAQAVRQEIDDLVADSQTRFHNVAGYLLAQLLLLKLEQMRPSDGSD